jgi:hypothetical protein
MDQVKQNKRDKGRKSQRQGPAGGKKKKGNLAVATVATSASRKRRDKREKKNKEKRKPPVIVYYGKPGEPGPRMPKTSKFAEVNIAYDNLFRFCDIDPTGPAPINVGNRKVSPVAVAGFVTGIKNYAPSNAMLTPEFQNLFIQQADPYNPILKTAYSAPKTDVAYRAQSNYPVMRLEIYDQSTWGTFLSTDTDGQVTYTLSNATSGINGYISNSKPHAWTFDIYKNNTFYTAQVGILTDINSNVRVFWRSSGTPAWNYTTIQGGATFNIVLTPAPSSTYVPEVLQLAFEVETNAIKPFVMNMILLDTGPPYIDTLYLHSPVNDVPPGDTDIILAYPYMYNLKSLINSNFVNIASRSDEVRPNNSRLVLTNVMANLYRGGTVLCNRIVAPDPPKTTYETYLWSLSKHYMNDLMLGLTTCWWGESSDFEFRSPGEYPTNPLANPNQTVNMFILQNVAVSGATNDSLSLQCKFESWVDYCAGDNTIANVEVVTHNDEWASLVSYVTKLYMFSDNPTHEKVLAFVKKAASFMMGGDPRAVAIRKAAKSIGGKVGQALLETALAF